MKVSIIIPAYNVEKYLMQCLDSVINQTYKNFEIIIVDDGSTDRTGEICDDYAKADNRIRVLHKKNEGLVRARKDGIKLAEGDFVYFIDSDDWIDNDTIESAIKIQSTYQADVVIDDFIMEYDSYKIKMDYTAPAGVYKGSDFLETFLYSGIFFSFGAPPSVCGKLFKTGVYKNLQNNVPDSIRIGEDVAVSVPYMARADIVFWNKTKFSYHYRQSENSMVRVSNNPTRFEESNRLFELLDRSLGENEKAKNRLQYYYLSMLIGLVKNETNRYKNLGQLSNRINEILNSQFYSRIIENNSLDTKTMSMKYRLFYNLVRKRCAYVIAILFSVIASKVENKN